MTKLIINLLLKHIKHLLPMYGRSTLDNDGTPFKEFVIAKNYYREIFKQFMQNIVENIQDF